MEITKNFSEQMKIAGTFVPIIFVKSETENAFYKIKKARKTKMLKNEYVFVAAQSTTPTASHSAIALPAVLSCMRKRDRHGMSDGGHGLNRRGRKSADNRRIDHDGQ